MREKAKWTDIAIVILTVGIVLFACMQWLEMRGTGKQTDQLLEYAQAQARSAGDFADSAKWMEEHMDDAPNAVQDSVDTADRNTKTP